MAGGWRVSFKIRIVFLIIRPIFCLEVSQVNVMVQERTFNLVIVRVQFLTYLGLKNEVQIKFCRKLPTSRKS